MMNNGYEKQKKTLQAKIKAAVEHWFVQACADPSRPLFLFYKQNQLDVSIHPQQELDGAGWILATPTPVGCGMTKEQVHQWSYQQLQNCPVYPLN